ncbi:hypothetical protein BHQ21_25560 [Mycobacterium sherrisii]|uniref:Uncharacterized protein n=1 Tax=Mycobacterium sherrisii TaxID=243061 RepID=A0A1E3SA92_9MYCO|nr:hypothetical protein BHQ21_25560 [Mycobacterium sherrisii]
MQRPRRGLANSFVGIDPSVEHCRNRIADLVTQKVGNRATRMFFHLDDPAVSAVNHQMCSLLESAGFSAKVV